MGNAALGDLNASAVERPGRGVVMVSDRTPMCTGGWMGRRRARLFLKGHDALMRAATTGCLVGVPFVS
jgi:hypothetical protein